MVPAASSGMHQQRYKILFVGLSGAWLGLVPKQISTGDRTILGKILRRGNRYLRVLFVQAARVVLARIKHLERYGLKSWIEAAKKRLHPTRWRLRSPTSLPASPGRCFTKGAPSSASRPMKRTDPLNPRACLGPSRRGPATLAREARQARRPTLTGQGGLNAEIARGASLHPQVGTKERPLGTNKGTGRNEEEQAMT